MKTRNQNRKQIQQFENNIDFDSAIMVWRKNKKSIGNGSYKYICEREMCNRSCYKLTEYCWIHRNANINYKI